MGVVFLGIEASIFSKGVNESVTFILSLFDVLSFMLLILAGLLQQIIKIQNSIIGSLYFIETLTWHEINYCLYLSVREKYFSDNNV